MGESKHGRWVIKRTAEYGKIETESGEPVAMVAREDDLHLIAAAPDLLTVASLLRNLRDNQSNIKKDPYGFEKMLNLFADQAEAAIAKAKGDKS